MNWQDMRAVARSLAYALLEAGPYLDQLTSKEGAYGVGVGGPSTSSIVDSMNRNQVSEFWHCLNRKWYVEGPEVGLRIVRNFEVDKAIAHTLAWLKWYQRGGHKEENKIPMPEWGKEYR